MYSAPTRADARQYVCHGLTADTLTGWMAAVGVTVVQQDLRLRWTDDPIPVAVLTHRTGKNPIEILTDSWKELGDRLKSMPGYRDSSTNKNDLRHISVRALKTKIGMDRGNADGFSLTSSLTDLRWTKDGKAVYGPFEISGPGSTKWAHHRALKMWRTVGDPASAIRKLFEGTTERAGGYGLGWDARRMIDVRDVTKGTGQLVEPVAETLAYFALALFPVRGEGKQVKEGVRAHQRGWGIGPYRENEFILPAWEQTLDRWAIDALLTAWHNTWKRRRKDNQWHSQQGAWELLGVHSAWKTASYRPKDRNDRNRGYGLTPLLPG